MMDLIIVGQGLVGSLLALSCQQAGMSVRVIDNGHQSSSTKVAAGIMNPLIGPRLSPIWQNQSQGYIDNVNYYRKVEALIKT